MNDQLLDILLHINTKIGQFFNQLNSFVPTETYDEARDFELDSQNISTNDDEGFASIKERKGSEVIGKTKRNCSKPARYQSTSSDDESMKSQTRNRRRIVSPSSSSSSQSDGTDSRELSPPPANYMEQKPYGSKRELTEGEFLFHNPPANNTDNSAEDLLRKTKSSGSDRGGTINDDSSGNPPDKSVTLDAMNDLDKIEKLSSETSPPKRSQNPSHQTNDRYNELLARHSALEKEMSDKPRIRSDIKTNIPIRIKKNQKQCDSPRTHDNPELVIPSTKMRRNDTGNNNSKRKSDIDGQLSSPDEGSNQVDSHGHLCCQKLLDEIESLKKMVSSIYLTLLDKNDMPDAAEKQIDFGLPIQSREQLTVFENELQKTVAATQYQKIVKQIGGITYEKHVRNALVHTLSDIMAYRMSWTGAKDTIMVRDMEFIKLMKDAITQKWNTADNARIEAVIKSWLQYAGDRLKTQ